MILKKAQKVLELPYHHGNLRNALLRAAIEVMAEKGVSQFSLSELARSVGVTPAAAYKHFADKDSLLLELAQHGFAELRQAFERVAPKAKPASNARQAKQRFELIGEAYLKFGLKEPALFQLIFGKGASPFRQGISSSGERTPTFAYFAEALDALHEFGLIAEPPTAHDQWFAWSAIHGATELLIAGVSGLATPKEAAGIITDAVVRSLVGSSKSTAAVAKDHRPKRPNQSP
jgi:AcrR family transcriptional regulator